MKPVSSAEFERRLQMTTKAKKSVKLLGEATMNNILNPGTTGAVMKQFLKITVRVMMRAPYFSFTQVTLTHTSHYHHSHPTRIV